MSHTAYTSSRFGAVRSALVILLICTPLLARAEGLSYRVEGVDDDLRANIRAHLGEAPTTRTAAERFLVTAPTRAAHALESLGYYTPDIGVTVDRARSPWRCVLRVDAGEPLRYRSVEVTLRDAGADDEALKDLLTRAPAVGDAVHHGRYDAFKADLQQLARRRGYFDAELAEHRVDVNVQEDAADLRLVFATGERYAFGELRADGDLLDPRFLTRLAPFGEGTPYREADLLELRQRLLRLGYFVGVVVLPEVADREAGRVPVRVEVARAPSHSYELGVGYSTDTRQRFSLMWRSPRLNRHGHSQETALRWSPVNPELRSTYSMPLDDPANDVLQVVARLESNEYGDLESDQRGLTLRRERTWQSRVGSLQLRALGEDWSAAGEDFDARFVLAGASFSTRERRGAAVDPAAGLSQFYEVEAGAAALGSDEDLLRLRAELVGVRRFAGDWRLVARGEAGLLMSSSERPDELPPSLAFFAGGDNSIRGYAYQSVGRELTTRRLGDGEGPERRLVVGGTRLLTASLEIQRYLTPTWRLAAFVDAGDAFTEDCFKANVGVGLGLHYLSPVGALRFEVADPVTSDDRDWRVHINIGAEF